MSEVLAAADAARLTEFSRAFKAAARAVMLYPDAHPAIATSLGRLAHLTASPQMPRQLRISVTSDSLLVGGQSVLRPDAAISELATLLHGHLIGEITILLPQTRRHGGASSSSSRVHRTTCGPKGVSHTSGRRWPDDTSRSDRSTTRRCCGNGTPA